MLKYFLLVCIFAFAAAKPGQLYAAAPSYYAAAPIGTPLAAAAPYFASPLTYSAAAPLAYSSSSYIRPALSYAAPYAAPYAYNGFRSSLAYSGYPAAAATYIH